MVERGIGNKWQIVQFEHVEVLGGAGGQAQLPDAFVGNELAMRQADGLQARAAGTQDAQGAIGDEYTFLQVHFFQ